jgi:tRNA(Ile)-lysidine synthase
VTRHRGHDPGRTLPRRLAAHLEGRGLIGKGDRVLVALSGGGDSTALLHLLLFARALPPLQVVAAHVNHAMRPGADSDEAWVRGLCRGWGVELLSVRLHPPPSTEAGARRLRYEALEQFRRESDSDLVVTAHHADDQAETVLFRALRGAGPGGLRGIRERRPPHVVRPLLPFAREELEAYATSVGLRVLADPSNLDPRWTRNRIRHELIPLARSIVPGAVESLARLAELTDEREEGWEKVLDAAEERVVTERSAGRLAVARGAFLAYHSAVQTGLLRRWIRTFGGPPGEAATRLALDVASSGPSGRRVMLPGGALFQREFDRLLLLRPQGVVAAERPVELSAPAGGSGVALLGGRRWRVSWGTGDGIGSGVGWEWERFTLSGLRFPLTLRGRRPGDRIRLEGGTRKLKKVVMEARVPRWERDGLPVLVDREGEVLWVPGVARAFPGGGAGDFLIGVTDADDA